MSKKGATPRSRGKPKTVWQTPKIESFAVAEITESITGGIFNDGATSNAASTGFAAS